MSPRTEKQFEEIREEKRHLIMQTALELFATSGYDSTSISQIAKKAGISKGLLYNYFESKEHLIKAILNSGIDEVMELFDPNKDGVLEVSEMEFFIDKLFEMLREHQVFWKLFFSVGFQPSVFKLVEKRIESLYKPLTVTMIRYFEALGLEDPLTESILFGAMLDGIAMDYVMKPELFPVEKIKKELKRRYCTKK